MLDIRWDQEECDFREKCEFRGCEIMENSLYIKMRRIIAPAYTYKLERLVFKVYLKREKEHNER